YRRQEKRLDLLSNYRAIVTLSNHMRDEYITHGFTPERVHCLSSFLRPVGNGRPKNGNGFHRDSSWNLLFLGRMDPWKGGTFLIDALPQVCASLSRPVRVTFAGDGPERKTWEDRAARVQARTDRLTIRFAGWVGSEQREALLNESDLLAVPSVWP